jgi:hypothetical protein
VSIRPKAGLDGRGILVHMCQTRARFNVDTLDRLSRDEKDLAIGRLQLADDDPLKMPPPRFHAVPGRAGARHRGAVAVISSARRR